MFFSGHTPAGRRQGKRNWEWGGQAEMTVYGMGTYLAVGFNVPDLQCNYDCLFKFLSRVSFPCFVLDFT